MEIDGTIGQVSEPQLCSTSNSNSETTLSPSLCSRPPEEQANSNRPLNNEVKKIMKDSNENIASKSKDKDQPPNLSNKSTKVIKS